MSGDAPSHPKIETPVMRKRRWPYPLIWMIPICTAIGAGMYLKDYLVSHGPEIVIDFSDASGLMEGETKILHRGAEIGRVTSIRLSDDHRHALVHAQLQKREDSFASKGSSYWIVRPEVSEAGLKGLSTLLTGPYINAVPGKGEEEQDEFVGLSQTPRAYEDGEHFVLTTGTLGHVQDGSLVSYKGVPVGSVQGIELSNEADHLDIHIVVWSRYAALVRENSKFWIDSGVDFKAGLFSGAHLKLDSMKTLISGGIGFATPEKNTGQAAKAGTHFPLEEDFKSEWYKWSPHIRIHPRDEDRAFASSTVQPIAHERKK